jgi:hypothetical protein
LLVATLQDALANRTLVILIGQPRGGPLAWKSLARFVLDPLRADLATFFGEELPAPPALSLRAKYAWTLPERADWGDALEQIVVTDCPGAPGWRALLCPVPGIMLGGVTGCGMDGQGSGGILLAFRWAVHRQLTTLGLWNEYDHFVLSRADHLYLCPHFPMSRVASALHIPEGEDYEGITDRHLVARSDAFRRALDLGTGFLCRAGYYRDLLKGMNTNINSEMMMMRFFQEQNLTVAREPRTMLAVRQAHDPTRWQPGSDSHKTSPWGLRVKYTRELPAAELACGVQTEAVLQTLHHA